jgi:sodium-coupled neutral amino acid transporter 7/8
MHEFEAIKRSHKKINRMEPTETKTQTVSTQGFMKAGSTSVAIITLAKGTLGAGILALPSKAAFSGFPLFFVLLAIGGYFTSKSIQMIARGASQTGKYVFEEITEAMFGRSMGIVLGISMLLNCYGASIVYVIAIYDSLKALLGQVEAATGVNWPLYATLIIGGAVLVPLSVFEKINSLRIVSVAGVFGVFFTVASVVYALAYYGISPSFKPPTGSVATMMVPQGGFVDIMTVISTVTFAFCNQFNVPQVYDEMTDKSAKAVTKAAYLSTGLAMILYILTAVAGYLCYGLEIEKDIMLNFTGLIETGHVLIYIGISAVTLSVSVCHLLSNFPMRLSVIFFLPQHLHENRVIKLAVPLFTAVSTIAIACIYADLSIFLGLVGALTGSIICYIVPAMFSIRAKQMEVHQGDVSPKAPHEMPPIWSVKTVVANPVEYTMIVLGVVIGIVGTFCEFYSCFTSS